MSLVGTRPILQDELLKYELHHRARIAIKPGITGMWQVSGRSDITDFEEVVRLDTEYISKHGYTFYSQTDTEVVIKLVDYYYKKYNLGPIDAIAKTMVRVRGSYALPHSSGLRNYIKEETLAIHRDRGKRDYCKAVVCSKKATKKEKASEYLRIMLSVEDVPSAEIIRRMDRIGIKERTIRTVQKEIGIEAYRKQGIWYWHMPEPEEEVDEE